MQIMTAINHWSNKLFYKKTEIEPLAVFRIVFGLMMFSSTVRFILKGWVKEFYLDPKFHFTYYGFDFIKPFDEFGMNIIFGGLIVCTLLITLGLFYRFGIVTYFILFTYIELIDKTYYLNHYYFISLVSFLLIFLPANRYFSLDTYFGICTKKNFTPSWTINILKIQIGIVYFFAGIAKLNYHWLFEAQPLINWLKHLTDFPILGTFFAEDYVAFIFSWFGAIFDLFIFFILINNKLRIYGYFFVVVFHLMTALMFPIGVFPLVMIGSTLIFFSSNFHKKIISTLSFSMIKNERIPDTKEYELKAFYKPIYKIILITFFIFQLILPFRYLLYPGKLFWTEQGYRFSWRVMLIEKAGYAQFYVHEPVKDRNMVISNKDFLTPQQEKMMATQPDMILQFAHHLSNNFEDSIFYETTGEIINLGKKPKITADVKVALFNKGSRSFIDKKVNLSNEKRGFKNKNWVLPYED